MSITKKFVFPLLCLLLILSAFLTRGVWEQSAVSVMREYVHADARTPMSSYEITARRDLLALVIAYPGHISAIEKSGDGGIRVVMKSGKKILYDDKKTKTYEQKLADPDLQDMMEQIYPLSDTKDLPKGDFDPGRIRSYEFIMEVYGATKEQISSNLTSVSTGQGSCRFNKLNNAAPALKAAFVDVAALVKSNPAVSAFVYPLSGTFNYRVVAGTNRLSMHSFGIAVDLKLNQNDYWRYVSASQGQKRLDAYPRGLVSIFEANGFIWGGKWAHFDLVHYEYRPELIIKAKYQVHSGDLPEPWYGGFPDTKEIEEAVALIDNALK